MAERPILFSGDMVRAILRGTKTVTRRPVDMAKLRARLPSAVSPDFSFLPGAGAPARAGTHRAEMNPHGAVSVLRGDAEPLGVRPGEFHFVCPFADGDTHLGDFGKKRKEWVITPRESKLWVREAWQAWHQTSHEADEWDVCDTIPKEDDKSRFTVEYRATSVSQGPWRPSLHMPRWASRISLDVVSVRLERVQSITETDAQAEGIDPEDYGPMFGDPDMGQECRGAFALRWIKRYGFQAWAQNRWVWRIEFRKATSP